MIRTQAYNDFYGPLSFVGTAERCAEQAECLSESGVDEIACLIDFGIGLEEVIASLRRLAALQPQREAQGSQSARNDPDQQAA